MKQICKNSILELIPWGEEKTHHTVTKLDFWYIGNLSNTVISRKQGVGSSGNVSTSQPLIIGDILGFNVIVWLNFYKNFLVTGNWNLVLYLNKNGSTRNQKWLVFNYRGVFFSRTWF